MRILIALPALDESARLGDVLKALPSSLPDADDVAVLVVDDGSRDGTAEVARRHGADVRRHPRTLGVGVAFQTALAEAIERGVDVLVTIDADDQFDPREIPALLAPIARGEADFVTGSRFSDGQRPEGIPPLKLFGNAALARLVSRLSGQDLSDVSCGFRAYSAEALLRLNLFGRFTYTQETILDLAFKDLRLAEVPITVRYRADRRSRVAGSLLRYAAQALTIVVRTGRDFRPMRFFGGLAAVLFGLGLLLDGWLVLYFLRAGAFTPYKFVGFAGTACLLAGILVLGLALLADMLDRMRVNQERILYHERRRVYRARRGEKPGSPG